MEEAQSRSEKLKLLKDRAQAKRQRDAEGGENEGTEGETPSIKFRNYKVCPYQMLGIRAELVSSHPGCLDSGEVWLWRKRSEGCSEGYLQEDHNPEMSHLYWYPDSLRFLDLHMTLRCWGVRVGMRAIRGWC